MNDDVSELKDIYPFMNNYSYDSACEFIDNAPLDVVQLILIDLVLSDSLIVDSWSLGEENDRFLTVEAMARHEGIDPDLVRAELEAPTTTTPDLAVTPAPVATTTKPTKKKTATPKKTTAPDAQAIDAVISEAEKIKPWPYPTSKTAQPDPVAASAEAKPAKKTLAKQAKKPAAPQTNWPYPNIETQAK